MNFYLVIKALHIISVIAWMAGMLYLPRLFAYHAGVAAGSETSELFKVMERRLLRLIINPAMIATFVFGIILIVQTDAMQQGWFHAKLALVILMSGIHGWLSGIRKKFERDENNKSQKFYKFINEVPTILLIGIVFLVVLKPF